MMLRGRLPPAARAATLSGDPDAVDTLLDRRDNSHDVENLIVGITVLSVLGVVV